MYSSVDTSNPYESSALATQGVQRARRLSRLSVWRIMLGLMFAGLLFGICFTACLMILAPVFTHLFGFSPLGPPSGSSIAQAVVVMALFGVLASLPIVPFLLLANSKERLGFRMAFGILMLLGTSGWLFGTWISVANYSVRPLGKLSPFVSELVTNAGVIWLPSVIAAIAYAIWINILQNSAVENASIAD